MQNLRKTTDADKFSCSTLFLYRMASAPSIAIDHPTRVLGTGPYGDMRRGTFSGVSVAVKRILISTGDKLEGESLAKLAHDNVVRLLHAQYANEIR